MNPDSLLSGAMQRPAGMNSTCALAVPSCPGKYPNCFIATPSYARRIRASRYGSKPLSGIRFEMRHFCALFALAWRWSAAKFPSGLLAVLSGHTEARMSPTVL